MEYPDIFRKTHSGKRVQDIADLKNFGGYVFGRRISFDPELAPAEVLMDGRRTLMFGSNDYLGLTRDARIVAAAVNAAEKFGTGCSGSRLLNGTTELHLQLEQELAEFLGKESAILCSTGFQTNLAAVGTLAGVRDVLLADEYCHACIEEGMRLSYGRRLRFRHNDTKSLREMLQDCSPDRGRFVLIEGVYSMAGDLAPLPEIVDLCREYGARLFLDDAHGIGVLGEHGRGTTEHFGLGSDVDIISGTFSKSLASLGGFLAADAEVIEYLRHYAMPYAFSASLPPSAVAAASAALLVVREDPERLQRLRELCLHCRQQLVAAGFAVSEGITPIVAVRLSSQAETRIASGQVGRFCSALFEEGFYANPVMGHAVSFPMVRIHVTLLHTEEQICALVAAMQRALERCRLDNSHASNGGI